MANHDYSHRPVLLDEVLKALKVLPDGIYVDATFGRGGHAGALDYHAFRETLAMLRWLTGRPTAP